MPMRVQPTILSRLLESSAADAGVPGVVSITRILDRTGFRPIEAGPFNVRIILTEDPKGGLTTALIDVVNGSATSVTKGLTYKGGIPEITGDVQDERDSELTPAHVDYYFSNGGLPLRLRLLLLSTAQADGSFFKFPPSYGSG